MFENSQMVDLETLGKRAGFSILVIGAVAFDPFMPWAAEGQHIARAKQFKVRISRESNLKYGLAEDPDTVKWWEGQSEEARAEAFGGEIDLKDGLQMYIDWCLETFPSKDGEMTDCRTYCHGGDFDKPILSWTMEKLGLKPPFPYNGTRDTRGILELAGVAYKGTKHTVIDDCYGQCAAICRSHDIMGFNRLANRLPGWLLPYEGLAFPVNISTK